MAARGVANDRRGASDLIANAIEHAPLDPGHWRGDPRKPRGMDSDAARKVSIQFHPAVNLLSLQDLLQQFGQNPQITPAGGFRKYRFQSSPVVRAQDFPEGAYVILGIGQPTWSPILFPPIAISCCTAKTASSGVGPTPGASEID